MKVNNKIIMTMKTIKNLGTFIFDYLGLIKRNKELVYKTKKGLKFLARAKTTDSAEIIVINSDYEYPKRYFPKNKNPIILDIGSNIGSFSLYLYNELKRNDPKIFAIEPSKENFEYLTKNINFNGFKSIKCFNIAISDKNGLGYLKTNTDYDAFKLCSTNLKGCEKIRLETLESFCKKNHIKKIDLMKMDIEGSEYEVFDHSLDFVKKTIKSFFIELHVSKNEKDIKDFKELLIRNRFSIENEIDNNKLFIKNLNIQ